MQGQDRTGRFRPAHPLCLLSLPLSSLSLPSPPPLSPMHSSLSRAAGKSTHTLDKRERGFDLTGLQAVKLKEYNALHDPNMRHFFESKQNQYLLYRTGQIDSNGRVIDLDKNKSKLAILEREFKEAEKIEEKRLKEEQEMRVRIGDEILIVDYYIN
jgi:hypothetical protein